MANPIVTIEMESGAVMSGELYPELAGGYLLAVVPIGLQELYYDDLQAVPCGPHRQAECSRGLPLPVAGVHLDQAQAPSGVSLLVDHMPRKDMTASGFIKNGYRTRQAYIGRCPSEP